MSADVWLEEAYFDWLKRDAFEDEMNAKRFEGVLRELHDIPFYWTIWSDENRAGDALSFRQYEFLVEQPDLDRVDQFWLGQWATAAPSALEVLLAIARRWHYYFEDSVPYYFGHLFNNLELNKFPGKRLSTDTLEHIRSIIDDWLSRQFRADGLGSPFPVHHALDVLDMRKVDIWGQMNAYSAEHFQ